MTSAATEPTTSPTSTREWIARVLILAILVGLRWIAFQSAGGLWRDEVHSLDMATSPLGNGLFALTNDSFPALWQGLLRGWIALFGSTDPAARWLGFCLGLSVIPAMWWAARPFGVRFPWWSMVLLGMDPSMIVYGGQFRGYVLGVATFFVLLGVVGRVGTSPTPKGWVALILASLLAIHFSYSNCFMLAAILMAQAMVASRRGRLKQAIGFLTVGVLAATTMLPYALWTMPRLARAVHHAPTGILERAQVFWDAYLWGGRLRACVWPIVGCLGVWGAGRRAFVKVNRESADPDSDQAYFWLALACIGTLCFWSYMQLLGVSTQHWYYLPFLALLAVTADFWARQPSDYSEKTAIVATVVGVLIACELCFTPVGPQVAMRFTTVDLAAKQLEGEVRAGDLIIVSPWYAGLTFRRYYHGPAEWIMLPNLKPDRMIDGYPEVQDKFLTLSTPESIKPELAKIRATLQAGGRIWWVGLVPKLPPAEPPLRLTAAPDPNCGWAESAYNESWRQLAVAEARSVGIEIRDITVPNQFLTTRHENPRLYVFERLAPSPHEPARTTLPTNSP